MPWKESLKGLDKTYIDFLSSQKTSTRNTYKSFLRRISEFTNMTGEQVLASKKADKGFEWERKAIEFKQWMKQQGYSDNSAETAINTLRSFFDYYRTPLTFTQTETRKLNTKAKRVTKDYMITNEDIAKLVFVGNLREKYVILAGKSFGLRVGDFCSLTYGCFRSINLNAEVPIYMGETQTEKEGVIAHPFIDSDALPVIKAMLDANTSKPDNERIITVQEEELSTMMQQLAVKANINLGGKHLRFHCLRKYLIDRLSSMMSESKWKQIVGKAISEDAYVSSLDLRESYTKVMKLTTCINGNGNGKVSKLSEEVTKLQTEVKNQQEEIKTLKSQIDKWQNKGVVDNLTLDWLLRELQNKGINLNRESLDKVMKDKTEPLTFDERHNLVEREEGAEEE